MARLRRAASRVEVDIPVELLDPFLPLWGDDDRVQGWRSAHGLPAYRWQVLPGHRRRHGAALDDWSVQQGLVNADGRPDWQRLRLLLRNEGTFR